MHRSGLGFTPKSQEEIEEEAKARKQRELDEKRRAKEEHSDEERQKIGQRTFASDAFEEDGPAVVESSEIDPTLLRQIETQIEKTPEESKREKEKFKRNKEKKEKTGSLKLKGMVLKGAGKGAHFQKAGAKKDSHEKTAEELLDERVKQKYDKHAPF